MHEENKSLQSFIFDVFHIEISGKYIKDKHPENNFSIFSTLFISHFEISGYDSKLEHR